MPASEFDPEATLALLGTRGHIAFEIHDNDPRMGEARWAPNAACRWRNITAAAAVTNRRSMATEKNEEEGNVRTIAGAAFVQT